MWDLRSFAIRTDLFLIGFDGVVEDRGRYLVVRTPSNPDFWWGNFLYYRDAPDARAAERGHDGSWLDDLDREMAGSSAKLLAWDRPDGTKGIVEPFLGEGFALDESAILTVREKELVRPPRANDDVKVRPISTDAEWALAAGTLVNAFMPNRSGSEEDVRIFIARQVARYRAMQARGLGQWFGAFIDGEIAGALGIIHQEELGRFQLVGTDPRFARRGVCSTLVHDAARIAFGEMGLTRLVMAADATYHAAKVYESVGFLKTEQLFALLRKPPRV